MPTLASPTEPRRPSKPHRSPRICHRDMALEGPLAGRHGPRLRARWRPRQSRRPPPARLRRGFRPLRLVQLPRVQRRRQRLWAAAGSAWWRRISSALHHDANLWYVACPTQFATATDARLMLAINALPQDAWTRQDLRLSNDWAIPIPHGTKAAPSVPPAATPWSKSTFLAGRSLALSPNELQATLPRPVPHHGAVRGQDPPRCERAHRLHPFEGPLGCGLAARGGEGDASSPLTTPEGMKEGAALGWDDVRSSPEGIITREVTGDTHPGSPFERQMTYSASFGHPTTRTVLRDDVPLRSAPQLER